MAEARNWGFDDEERIPPDNWEGWAHYLREENAPEWFIDACGRSRIYATPGGDPETAVAMWQLESESWLAMDRLPIGERIEAIYQHQFLNVLRLLTADTVLRGVVRARATAEEWQIRSHELRRFRRVL